MNRVVLRRILELQRRRSENPVATSRRSSVMTLQCRDVLSTAIKVKERLNRHVPTSRGCNVATFPRFLHQNYKKHGRPNFRYLSKDVQTRRENEAGATQEIEKTHVLLFLFSKTINDL